MQSIFLQTDISTDDAVNALKLYRSGFFCNCYFYLSIVLLCEFCRYFVD